MLKKLIIAALLLSPVAAYSQTAPTNFVPLAPVQLVKSTGMVRAYGLGAPTDVARGTALINAVAAAVAGDKIEVGPGTYDLGSSRLASTVGLSLRGAGKGKTTFTTSYSIANNAAYYFPTGSRLSGITFNQTGVTGCTVGANSADTAVTDVRFTDCEFNNSGDDTVSLNSGTSATISLEFFNCIINASSEDAVLVVSANSTVTLRSCFIHSASQRAILCGLGTVYAYDCTLISTLTRFQPFSRAGTRK